MKGLHILTTCPMEENVTIATLVWLIETVKSARSFFTNFNSDWKLSAPTLDDASTKKTNSTFWN